MVDASFSICIYFVELEYWQYLLGGCSYWSVWPLSLLLEAKNLRKQRSQCNWCGKSFIQKLALMYVAHLYVYFQLNTALEAWFLLLLYGCHIVMLMPILYSDLWILETQTLSLSNHFVVLLTWFSLCYVIDICICFIDRWLLLNLHHQW